MNRINIKDRKILTLGLCLILVCIFTLTIAYAALNAVLTIQGSAEVTASTWNIYLDNARVISGSATTDVPTITSGKTLTFSATLNMPGDYYEFTVDVVNAGSIDAMIDKVTKTPELTEEQAKFLKYEVTYENGESITTKQTLSKGTTTPIKVRIEYRNDLSNTDLPSTQTVLNMSITLEYTQSDGTGTTIPNNGVKAIMIDGISYGYDDGMTWGEWVNSSYNTYNFIYESPNNPNSRIQVPSGACELIAYEGTSDFLTASIVIDPTQLYEIKDTNACK